MKYTAAVITVSDTCAAGEKQDTSGPAVTAFLKENGYEVRHTRIVPDKEEEIVSALKYCADEAGIALIVTTGGTGFSPRDITPEATKAVIERETPGLPELMRAESMKVTDRGCLSRGTAGIRGSSLILNLPGSRKAALENLSAVISPLAHGLEMLRGGGSAGCGEDSR